MSLMASKDTKTRFQGVYCRHQVSCPLDETGRCRCTPTYYGVVYDRSTKRQVKTKRMAGAEAARNARADLIAELERGEARTGGNLRLTVGSPAAVERSRHDARGVAGVAAGTLRGAPRPGRERHGRCARLCAGQRSVPEGCCHPGARRPGAQPA
jgi:hypothetical protein